MPDISRREGNAVKRNFPKRKQELLPNVVVAIAVLVALALLVSCSAPNDGEERRNADITTPSGDASTNGVNSNNASVVITANGDENPERSSSGSGSAEQADNISANEVTVEDTKDKAITTKVVFFAPRIAAWLAWRERRFNLHSTRKSLILPAEQ